MVLTKAAFIGLFLLHLVVFLRHSASMDRAIRFPFLFSIAWLVLVLPKLAFIFSDTNGGMATYLIASGAVTAYLSMAILCSITAYIGYDYGLNGGHKISHSHVSPPTVIAVAQFLGLSTLAISLVAKLLIVISGGGFLEYYLERAAYLNLDEGLPVKAFFSRLWLLAFASFGVAYRWSRSRRFLVLMAVALVIPVLDAVFLGRREQFASVILVCSYVAVTMFGLRLRREFILTGLAAGFVVVLLMPVLRNPNQTISESFSDLTVSDLLKEHVEFRPNNDNAAALFLVNDALNSGIYGLGTGFYNRIISQYVPAQLVGRERKEGLMSSIYIPLKIPNPYWIRDEYFFLYQTGPAEAFKEFSYFGSLIYFLFGFIFGRLQKHSISPSSNAIEIYILPATIIIVSTGVYIMVNYLVLSIIYLLAWKILFNIKVALPNKAYV